MIVKSSQSCGSIEFSMYYCVDRGHAKQAKHNIATMIFLCYWKRYLMIS